MSVDIFKRVFCLFRSAFVKIVFVFGDPEKELSGSLQTREVEKAALASPSPPPPPPPPPQHNLLFFTFSLLSKIKNFVNKHREQCASAAKEKQLKLFQGLQSSVYSQFKVISLIAWIFLTGIRISTV